MRLIRWNGLAAADFAAWEFLPGMRFAEREAWWRTGGERADPHEGLDIGWFLTGSRRRVSLGAGARVPVAYAGEVVSVVDDFLGVSLFVAHAHCDGEGRRLHTVYGHIDPSPGLVPGSVLGDADAVGSIAAAAARKSAVPSHLHVTLALIAGGGAPHRLDWEALRDRSRVLLLDPLPLLCGTMSAQLSTVDAQ